VSLLAVGIVLASALLHATWNVLLSRVPKGHDTTAVGLAIGFVAWTPVALWRWQLDSASGRTSWAPRRSS
jgi:hypothetical protein